MVEIQVDLLSKLEETISKITEEDLFILKESVVNFINTIEEHIISKKIKKSSDESMLKKKTYQDDIITSKMDYKIINDYKLKPLINKSKANNFYILYRNISNVDATNLLLKSFPGAVIINIMKFDNEMLIHLHIPIQKELHLQHSKLVVNGNHPIGIYTKPKQSQNFHNDKTYKQPFAIMKTPNTIKYDWMTNCKSQTIANVIEASDNFEKCEKFSDCIKLLLVNRKVCVNTLCLLFLKELRKMDVKSLNEILCIHIFLNAFTDIRDNIKLKILGVDYRYIEKVLNYTLYFRPDLVCMYEDILIIIEFKYRSDRRNQTQDAMNCLKYKQYGPRVLNYYKINRPTLYSNIRKVLLIGFSFTNVGILNCGSMFEWFDISEIDCESYKRLEFIIAMKQNKKRFKMLTIE